MLSQDHFITKEEELSQIAGMLLLNGTLTECPGLIHGKMGIAVFFFHYAQYTGNMMFADYAIDLIGEIQNQIHINSPADYERGIAGIGIGIDYLIRQKFLLVKEDICEDFDPRMIRAVMHDSWPGFGLYKGVIGYGQYWISRLRYPASIVQAYKCINYIIEQLEWNWVDISSEEQTDVCGFLFDLQCVPEYEVHCSRLLERCRDWENKEAFCRLGDSVIGDRVRQVQFCRYFGGIDQMESSGSLNRIQELDLGKRPVSTGLLTGYAGEGLLRLDALSQMDYSWTMLF